MPKQAAVKETATEKSAEERPREAARLWSAGEALHTIVKNRWDSLVVIPHGVDREIPALVLQPGEERILGDVEAWKRSANFRRAVEGLDGEAPKVEVFLAKAPRNRPTPPAEMTRNLTAQNLHTVDQILGLPFERALEIVDLKPQGGDVDSETGLSEVAQRWLVRTQLAILRTALWIEERWEKRPALLAALRRRIREIQALTSPV